MVGVVDAAEQDGIPVGAWVREALLLAMTEVGKQVATASQPSPTPSQILERAQEFTPELAAAIDRGLVSVGVPKELTPAPTPRPRSTPTPSVPARESQPDPLQCKECLQRKLPQGRGTFRCINKHCPAFRK